MRRALVHRAIAIITTIGACVLSCAEDDGDDTVADTSTTAATDEPGDVGGTCEDAVSVDACDGSLPWASYSGDVPPPVIGLDDPSIVEFEDGFFVPARDYAVIVGEPVTTGARCVVGCFVILEPGNTYCAVEADNGSVVGGFGTTLEGCRSLGH